ncbi:RDD family protein [Methanobacterium aggregans]|uniref:RDD family protein n=1 Tax=Methanobacterium aggregans TaxID=1615586 RepID=UPI001AE71A86|nr:RDD family protein [Methanobacterium aggregans]MBP2045731.1 putative RDD family membrane protein YckC [Methanobacterium aggregans]
MLCNECGESNINDAKFCQKCGAELGYEVQLASLGDRIIAYIIDMLVIFVLAFLAGLVIGLMIVFGGVQSTSDGFLMVVNYLVGFLLFFGYFILLEGPLGGGRTLGKRIIHIKVVKEEDLEVMDYTKSFVRNILRIIDGFICYLVAILLIHSSDKNQRLGDSAAHTLVIKEK